MLTLEQKRLWWIGGFFFVVLVALCIYFLKIDYTFVCDDDTCFSQHLMTCEKAEFVKDTTEAVWYYKINGPSSKDNCEIFVKLAQLRKGGIEIVKLEGKDMTCTMPLGIVETPQKDLERCHGVLKEEIQSLLIQKMHSYLLENLGQIGQEFTKII